MTHEELEAKVADIKMHVQMIQDCVVILCEKVNMLEDPEITLTEAGKKYFDT